MVKRRKQTGSGILSDIHKFVKDNKLISKGLGMIPNGAAQLASSGASMLGYGKRRKVAKKRRVPKRRVMTGTGIFSDFGSGVGNIFGGIGHGLFGSGAIVQPRGGLIIPNPVRM